MRQDLSPLPIERSWTLNLAIVDDFSLAVAGVASLLAQERIDVVETAAGLPVLTDVDVVLYDTSGQVRGQGIGLADFVRDSGTEAVIYGWNPSSGA